MKLLPNNLAFEKVIEDHEQSEQGYSGQLVNTTGFIYPQGMDPGNNREPPEAYAQLSEVFIRVGHWIYRGGRGNANGIKARFYAFIWITSPAAFDYMNETAMAAHIGVSKKRFSLAVTSFKDEFKFGSSMTKTEGMRAKLSAAAKRRHERERHDKTNEKKNQSN